MVEERSGSYFRERVEEGCKMEGGVNDKVFDTGETVVEYYPLIPPTGPRQALVELVLGDLRTFTRSERMENELEAPEFLESQGLNAARPLARGEKFIEFEKVDGESITSFDMEEMGEKVGAFLAEVHEGGAALIDGTLSNFLYSEDEGLYSVDHDSFSRNATSSEIGFDAVNTLTSAAVRPPEDYQGFRKGFEKDYGEFSLRGEVWLALNIVFFNLVSHDLAFLRNSVKNLGFELFNSG